MVIPVVPAVESRPGVPPVFPRNDGLGGAPRPRRARPGRDAGCTERRLQLARPVQGRQEGKPPNGTPTTRRVDRRVGTPTPWGVAPAADAGLAPCARGRCQALLRAKERYRRARGVPGRLAGRVGSPLPARRPTPVAGPWTKWDSAGRCMRATLQQRVAKWSGLQAGRAETGRRLAFMSVLAVVGGWAMLPGVAQAATISSWPLALNANDATDGNNGTAVKRHLRRRRGQHDRLEPDHRPVQRQPVTGVPQHHGHGRDQDDHQAGTRDFEIHLIRSSPTGSRSRSNCSRTTGARRANASSSAPPTAPRQRSPCPGGRASATATGIRSPAARRPPR